ncbi:hypothetical protein L7F22_038397 [Adiantum nelumboides]|nr:hypothetical protein [Adiantum nelumboides]
MLEYRFRQPSKDIAKGNESMPYLVVQASRPEWRGSVHIDAAAGEIAGWNSEQMDYRLGPNEALGFKGYFVFAFEHQRRRASEKATPGDETMEHWEKGFPGDYGTMFTNASGVFPGEPRANRRSNDLGTYAFVRFPKDTARIRVRVGMSMIDIAQARRNLQLEVGGYASFDEAVAATRSAWRRSLQYPAEHAEPDDGSSSLRYYSAYLDDVVTVPSEPGHGSMRYQSYSIWDTFRAEMGFLILFEPRRIVDMLRSMLDMYDEGGFLPMWSTGTGETNIMIGTHADSVLAEALVKGVGLGEDVDAEDRLDLDKIWEAVRKDANQPPPLNDQLRFADREEFTPYEVRAGLDAYDTMGYVPLDRWDESTSRTLDYAYDDAAVAVVGRLLNKSQAEVERLETRSQNYRNVFNEDTGRMAARFSNGTFLSQPLDKPTGRQLGFTEGNERLRKHSWLVSYLAALVTALHSDVFHRQLDSDHFASKHHAEDDRLRLIHYPPASVAEGESGSIRAGSHSDYGSLTLLFQKNVSGLQVQTGTDMWADVPPKPGCLVVNVGDAMEFWSAGLFRSTQHRVVMPRNEAEAVSRFSM